MSKPIEDINEDLKESVFYLEQLLMALGDSTPNILFTILGHLQANVADLTDIIGSLNGDLTTTQQ